MECAIDCVEGRTTVAVDQCLEERIEELPTLGCATGGDYLVERRQRVTGRAATRS